MNFNYLTNSRYRTLLLTICFWILFFSATLYAYTLLGENFIFSIKRSLAIGLILLTLGIFYTIFTRTYLKHHKITNILFISLVLATLIAPQFTVINYPFISTFQTEDNISIKIETRQSPNSNSSINLGKLNINTGNQIIKANKMEKVGVWHNSNNDVILESGTMGELHWSGKVGKQLSVYGKLPITNGLLTITSNNTDATFTLDGTYINFKNTYSIPFSYTFISITLATGLFSLFILTTLLLYAKWRFIFPHFLNNKLLISLIISFISISVLYIQLKQYDNIEDALAIQNSLHKDILLGTSPNPWQYRILAELILEATVSFLSRAGLNNPLFWSYIILRIIQNLLIFSLHYLFLKELNFPNLLALVGTVILGGSMLHLYYNNGFFLNTYFDLLFYILAGLMVLKNQVFFIPLLILIASLNRETSALIPMFLVAKGWENKALRTKYWLNAMFSFLVWAVIHLWLRNLFPNQLLFNYNGITPGIDLLSYNLNHPETFNFLFRTLGWFPLLALVISFSVENKFLKLLFWLITPLWGIAHIFGGVWAESRLFLVPQAIVFIPFSLVAIGILLKKHPIK